MATYDDYDGVFFTLQSLLLHHEMARDDRTEIIIIDNNPSSKHGEAVKGLCNWHKNKVRYIPFTAKKSTATRNEIFRNAKGKYCVSMDCHVLLPHGSLESLMAYYSANPNCKDIVSGPMMYDNHTGYATHFKPTWGGDMYGQWDANKAGVESGKPFEIPMMGLGTFSVETKHWQWFNENFRGFGGEEGYIHEKHRQNGGKAVCVPGFKWLHRFGRPSGVPYPLALEDRIWNYLLGWIELKQDPEHQMIKDIYDNFKKRIPEKKLQMILKQAVRQNEIDKQNSQQQTEGANNANPIPQ